MTAMGPAPLLLDAALRPLTPAVLFGLDDRAAEQRQRLGVGLDHAAPAIAWWAETQPKTASAAAWACDLAGYATAALTGAPAMDTDRSRAGDLSSQASAAWIACAALRGATTAVDVQHCRIQLEAIEEKTRHPRVRKLCRQALDVA